MNKTHKLHAHKVRPGSTADKLMLTGVFVLFFFALESFSCSSIGSFTSSSVSKIKYEENLNNGKYSFFLKELGLEYHVSFDGRDALNVVCHSRSGIRSTPKYFQRGDEYYVIFLPLSLGADFVKEFQQSKSTEDSVIDLISGDCSPEYLLEELDSMDFPSRSEFAVVYIKIYSTSKRPRTETIDAPKPRTTNVRKVPGRNIFTVNFGLEFTVASTAEMIEVQHVKDGSTSAIMRITNGRFNRVLSVESDPKYPADAIAIYHQKAFPVRPGIRIKPSGIIIILMAKGFTEADIALISKIMMDFHSLEPYHVALRLESMPAFVLGGVRAVVLSNLELFQTEPHKCVREALEGKTVSLGPRPKRLKSPLSLSTDP